MKRFLIVMTAVACVMGCAAKVKVVAHRGYWDTPGSAQNSIASLLKADSIGADASEFDVWLTADDNLVCFHDDVVNGRRVEESTLRQMRDVILANGERVPTLEEYLNAALSTGTRLVLEIKPHTDKARELLAIEMIMCLVNDLGLNNRIDYITFSPVAFKALAERTSKPTEVYYLEGDLSPEEIEALGGDGLDYHINVFKRNPEWIDDAHNRRLKVNVWTVNDPADMQWCIDRGVDFITTNAPVDLQKLVK